MKKIEPSEGAPYSPHEFITSGITVIILGLLMVIFFTSLYLHGSEAQMVSTKWGTKILEESGPKNITYLVFAGLGASFSLFGFGMLINGIRRGNKTSNHGLESTGAPPAAGTPETHP